MYFLRISPLDTGLYLQMEKNKLFFFSVMMKFVILLSRVALITEIQEVPNMEVFSFEQKLFFVKKKCLIS